MNIVFLQYVGYGVDIIIIDVDQRGSTRRPIFGCLNTFMSEEGLG